MSKRKPKEPAANPPKDTDSGPIISMYCQVCGRDISEPMTMHVIRKEHLEAEQRASNTPESDYVDLFEEPKSRTVPGYIGKRDRGLEDLT